MNRNRRAIIVGGILKIRRPLESKEPEHILRAFAKENALFNKFVLSAPAGIDATVEYLLDNSKNESEWEVTCRAAEALFEKTGNTEIVDRILKRTDTEADKDVISSLFYSIKKLLILNWENKEVVDRIVQHSYTKENEYYFAVALSEALKTSQSMCAWLDDLLSQKSNEFKAYFLSNLLLDRNHKLYFDIKRYEFLYKINDTLTELLIAAVKERVTAETLQSIAKYLALIVDSPDSMIMIFDKNTLIQYIGNMRPATIANILTTYQRRTNEMNSMVQKLSHEKLLAVSAEYLNKEYRIAAEDKPIQSILLRIQQEIEEICTLDKFAAVKILLSENIIAEPIEAMLLNSMEEMKELLNEMLKEYTSEEKAKNTESTGFLERYANLYDNAEHKSKAITNRAICNGIRLLKEEYTLDTLVDRLARSEGKDLSKLLLEMIITSYRTESKLLRKCWEYSDLKGSSINVKEHIIKMEEILEAESDENALAIASTYLCSVLNTLPLLALKVLVRDRRISKCLWSIIMRNYRKYEASVLAGLTNSSVLLQNLPNGKTSYETQDVSGLEGEGVIFMVPHILDTKYPLQYLQIIDKMKLFSAEESASGYSVPTKWKYEKENKTLKYEGVDSAVSTSAVEQTVCITENESGYLTSAEVYRIVQETIISMLSKETVREYALHALIGEFIDRDADIVKKISIKHPNIHPKIIEAIQTHWIKAAPELLERKVVEEKMKRQAPEAPTRKERKTRTVALSEGNEHEEKEECRRTGIMSAQLSVSRTSTDEDVDKIYTTTRKYDERQMEEISEHFFQELERYWRTDRDKISSHFDRVVRAIKIFSKSKNIDKMGKIISGYFDYSFAIESEAADVSKEIVKRVLEKNAPEKAFSILNAIFKDRRVVEIYADVLKEASSETIHRILSKEKPGSFLHQAGIQSVHARKNEQIYSLAITEAISQLASRDDDALNSSLYLLKEEYKTNAHSPYAAEIVSHAVRLLRMRTKMDSAGRSALEILKHALFHNDYQLDINSREDIIASIKYDVYQYKEILLLYIDEVPANEFVEIVGDINSPTAKSARNALRQAIKEYKTEDSKAGVYIFNRIIQQASDGSTSDKIFIIELVKEIVEQYAHGAWITIFLKVSEMIANEEKEEVITKLLELMQKVVAKSQNKKGLKSIYKEWKENKKLDSLVRKMANVFK